MVFNYVLRFSEEILLSNSTIHIQLAAWPGFARPPARGVLVVLVQVVSKAFLVIGLFRVAKRK